MGFHSPILATSEFASGLGTNGQDPWYPTSREKRARYGAPKIRWHLEFQSRFFASWNGTAELTSLYLERCVHSSKMVGGSQYLPGHKFNQIHYILPKFGQLLRVGKS